MAPKKTAKKAAVRKKTERIWHLVTNHQNMLYMLAAGMVMEPAGFGNKYYADTLKDYPGKIPLFRDKAGIPADAIKQSVSERKHLLPCIASFNVNDVCGELTMLAHKGKTRTRKVKSLPQRKGSNEVAALIPAPLPLSLLRAISFRTDEEMLAFTTAAGDVTNIDLSHCRVEVSEPIFAQVNDDITWPQPGDNPGLFGDSHIPARGFAVGGAIAMLYHLANRSDAGLAALRLLTDAGAADAGNPVCDDPVLAELSSWLHTGIVSEQADSRARLYWGVVDSLVDNRASGSPKTPVDVTIDYLQEQHEQINDPKIRQRLHHLHGDIRSAGGLGGGTVTELLEKNKGSLSRPLLLFCLRERCIDLLEFSHPLVNDTEVLLAGILFGVRDGWLQLPGELRGRDLSRYVSSRMAAAEHQKAGQLRISTPPCPVPLRAYFTTGESFNYQATPVAIDIASRCRWHDCIESYITLPDGDLPATFSRQGQQLVLPGLITVQTRLDEEKFLQRLGEWPPMPAQTEAEARDKLVALTAAVASPALPELPELKEKPDGTA
jgi:hypothetical protein